MSSPKSVIITFPKGLPDPKAVQANELIRGALPRLNFTASILTDKRMDARKILQVSPKQEEMRSDDDFATFIKTADACVRGKKRRLDHLTWEEKLQRKKLKNRVAAQTSRDRKKARLDELEETVKTLRERNEELVQECTMLRSQNESLLSEAKRLRREKDTSSATGDQQQQYCSACQARVGCAAPLPGSAVSPDYPLPQGGSAQPAPCPTLTPRATILLNFLIFYLLSRRCCLRISKAKDPASGLENSRVFWMKLPVKLKQILIEQMSKCASQKNLLKNLTVQKQWWGRHQKMWKPIESAKA